MTRFTFWVALLLGVGWIIFFAMRGEHVWAVAFGVVTVSLVIARIVASKRARSS
jgi:hypothetical protein